MTRHGEIWPVLGRVLDDKKWISVAEIYDRLARELRLSDEEFDSRWKRNVRNVLQRRKARGDILWDRHGKYRLPEPEGDVPEAGLRHR